MPGPCWAEATLPASIAKPPAARQQNARRQANRAGTPRSSRAILSDPRRAAHRSIVSKAYGETDAAQHLMNARGAERALVAADTGFQRGWRQCLVAVLAAWPQVEHQCIRAAASAFARPRLCSSGASRSRIRFTRSTPAFSGLPE